MTISFILNNTLVTSELSAGYPLLDFIRNEQNLKGTKIGCREGDCGACTILLGTLVENHIDYKAVNSCLLATGELQGKHIVTIEGINKSGELIPVQQLLADERASQCGFCTPGIVNSITGYMLTAIELSEEKLIEALDGNLCRCTGYTSIKRSVESIISTFREKYSALQDKETRMQAMVDWGIVPEYFLSIPEKLKAIENKVSPSGDSEGKIIAGGTDLYVQHYDEMYTKNLTFLNIEQNISKIEIKDTYCYIPAGTSVDELYHSEKLTSVLPEISKTFGLISSTPIRNRATLGGNLVNASPIADLAIFFLALNAEVILEKESKTRIIALKDFYLDYKKLDLNEGERLIWLRFSLPKKNTFFHFEKISKRLHLDIASVNSAFSISYENDIIKDCSLSAGGVAAIPKYLENFSRYLIGKELKSEVILNAIGIARTEVMPISDIRGSKEYKSLLLEQCIIAHFLTLFPEKLKAEDLL